MPPGTTSAKSTRHKSCVSQSLPSPVLGVQNMTSLRSSMGQSNLGKSRRNDTKLQAELGPHPNQTCQELNVSFLPLHADSAPPGSGEVHVLKVLGDFKPLCSPSENLLSSSWLLVPLSSCEVWQNQPTGDLPAPAEVREGSLCSWWDLP